MHYNSQHQSTRQTSHDFSHARRNLSTLFSHQITMQIYEIPYYDTVTFKITQISNES